MDQQAIVLDIEDRAYEARISVTALCLRAGIHPSTFFRWKKTEKNPEPTNANMGSLRKLHDTLEAVAAERARKAGKGKVAA